MDLGIEGLSALVTGAAGGVGRAVAVALAREGARVAMLDRDAAGVQRAAAELTASGALSLAIACDVTVESDVARAVAQVVRTFGGIDILVGCAGISGPFGTAIGEVSRQQWDEVFAVNVTGAFLVITHALPALKASTSPSVVVVASDSAVVGSPGMVPYCASKAALVQFARSLAVELDPTGVRVNAICPSIIDTAMSRADLDEDHGFEGAQYPVQTPEEVADHIIFLSSPKARAVNAAAVISDFGYSARSTFPA